MGPNDCGESEVVSDKNNDLFGDGVDIYLYIRRGEGPQKASIHYWMSILVVM